MGKVEYSDLNKFLVSIGIAFIAIAVFSQFFFLKETFGLYIDKELVAKFPPEIIESIQFKERQILRIQHVLPWLSGIFILIGFLSFTIGLKRWFFRQAKMDAKFDLETEKIQREIQGMTPSQVLEKATEEVKENEQDATDEQISFNSADSLLNRSSVSNYLKIEEDVVSVFQNYGFRNFDVLANQLIGGKLSVDLMLIAKNKTFYDYIFEIKYFKRRLDVAKIEKAVKQLSQSVWHYKSISRKNAIPIAIVVFSPGISNQNKILEIKQSLELISKSEDNLKHLSIEFIPEDQIHQLDIKRIVKLKPDFERDKGAAV
jgi:hypothetical protein